MIAQIFFYRNGFEKSIEASAFTDREGRYPTLAPVLNNAPLSSIYLDMEKSSFGVDSATNIVGGFRAPASAIVISPITHMLTFGNSQDKLKRQLGLAGLTTDRDLLSFDPVKALTSTDLNERADAERIVAAHIRLNALACVIRRADEPVRFLSCNFDSVAKHLANYPASSAFSENAISELLSSQDMNALNGQIQSAMVRIIKLFLDLSPDRVVHRSDIVRFELAANGYLTPLIKEILLDSTGVAATRANAITATDMSFAIMRYGEALTYAADARYFPAPDYYRLPRNGSLTVAATENCSCTGSRGPFTYNDAHFRGAPNALFMGWLGTKTITAVEVPPQNQSEISATLNGDGTVTMAALASFVGLTYFDYVSTHEMGDTARGRVYVWVR